jgi:hypothetical protein
MLAALLMTVIALAAGGPDAGDPADPLSVLAAEFREQRREIRTDSPRAAELRHWAGPMHRTMEEIRELVTARRLSRARLEALLGPPDETVKEGGNWHGTRVPKGETRVVYWWRGGHDCLGFVVRKGVVVSAKWWMALE